MTAFLTQLRLLLWKNGLLMSRSWRATLCTILVPCVFVGVLVGVWAGYASSYVPTSERSGDALSVLPLGCLAARLQLAGQVLAVTRGGSAAAADVASLVAALGAGYTGLNMTAAFPAGLGGPELSSLVVPPLVDTILTFTSEAAMEAFVRDPGYGVAGSPQIWAAIVLLSAGPRYEYALRFNASEVPDTTPPLVDPLSRGLKLQWVASLVADTPSFGSDLSQQAPANPIEGLDLPGFTSLQLAVDRQTIGKTVNADRPLDAAYLRRLFQSSLQLLNPAAAAEYSTVVAQSLASGDAATLAAIDAVLQPFFAAEALAPQQATLIPFPVTAYTQDGFYALAQSLLSIVMVLAYLYPVSRLLRGLVEEKESKQRQGMVIMGVSHSAIIASWLVTYAGVFTLLAALLAIMTGTTLFSASNGFLLFLLYLLFGLAAATFCYALSTLFSRTRSAVSVGVVAFLALAFPYYGVAGVAVSTGAKIGASVCAPTAFALAIDIFSEFASSGSGATFANAANSVRGYSLAACLAWLAGDALLYFLAGMAAERWLPGAGGADEPSTACERGAFRCGPSAVPRRRRRRSHCEAATSVTAVEVAGPDGVTMTVVGNDIASHHADEAAGDDDATRDGAEEGLTAGAPPSPASPRPQPRELPAANPLIEPLDAPRAAKLSSGGSCISIRGLTKVFPTPDGPLTAVDALDLDLFTDECTVLAGHNGAGKSSTVAMLSGLLRPTSGSIRAFGRELCGGGGDAASFTNGPSTTAALAEFRQNLGIVLQYDVYWPELSVREHLAFFGALKGLPAAALEGEVRAAVGAVGLLEKLHARAGTLSGGQKRKLSLAIALLGDPRVLILDEVSSAQDPAARRATWQCIRNAKAGRVVLLVTHFLEEADILGDRVVILGGGRVRCAGTPAFLKACPALGVGYVLSCFLDEQRTQQQQAGGQGQGRAAVEKIQDGARASGALSPAAALLDAVPDLARGATPGAAAASDAVDADAANATQRGAGRSELMALIRAHVPSASPLSCAMGEVTMMLPLCANAVFPALLSALDALCTGAADPAAAAIHGSYAVHVHGSGATAGGAAMHGSPASDGTLLSAINAAPGPSAPAGGGALPSSYLPHPSAPAVRIESYSLGVSSLESCFLRIAEESAHRGPAGGDSNSSATNMAGMQHRGVAAASAVGSVPAWSPPPALGHGYPLQMATSPPPAPHPATTAVTTGKGRGASELTDEDREQLRQLKSALRRQQSAFVPAHGRPPDGDKGSTDGSAPFTPSAALVFLRHTHALLLKRALMTARDGRALVYQLFIPVLILLGGLLLLQLAIPVDEPDYTLSTLQFNTDPRGNPSLPVLPAALPAFVFKPGGAWDGDSSAGGGEARISAAPTSSDIEHLLNCLPASVADPAYSPRFDGPAAAALSPLDAATLRFINTSTADASVLASQHMASYLLASAPQRASSVYGAFLFGGSGSDTVLGAAQNDSALFFFQPPSPAPAFVEAALVVMHNSSAAYASAIMLNAATSALLAASMGPCVAAQQPAYGITTHAHPLPLTLQQSTLLKSYLAGSAATIMMIGFAFSPASYAAVIVKERETGAKHLQLVSGVSIPAYWVAAWLWDSVSFLVPGGLCVMLYAVFQVADFVGETGHRLAALIALFALYSLASPPFAYVLSFAFRSHSSAQSSVLLVGMASVLLMIISMIMGQVVGSSGLCYADGVLRYLYRLLPGWNLGAGLYSLAFLDILPGLLANCGGGDASSPAGASSPSAGAGDGAPPTLAPIDALDWRACGLNILYLAIESAVYPLLAIAIDTVISVPTLRYRAEAWWAGVCGMSSACCCCGNSARRGGSLGRLRRLPAREGGPPGVDSGDDDAPETPKTDSDGAPGSPVTPGVGSLADSAGASEGVEDDDVRAERRLVSTAEAGGVVIKGLRKVYPGGKVAVADLSFRIHPGDVFVLLGVNGGGKSTTLKMLTGDLPPTAGTATLNGCDILTQQERVRHMLGYAPQSDALLEGLTTREHIELYARLRGVPERLVRPAATELLEELDLSRYGNKLASTLSGGNKRKLSLAIALVGWPAFLVLDEVSTGCDPVSRRILWSAIGRAAGRGSASVLLVSHSFQECEAMANRTGIMVGGRLTCLGTVAHVRSRHGLGYQLEVKLADPAPAAVDATLRAASEFLRLSTRQGLPGGGQLLPRSQLLPLVAHLGGDCTAFEAALSPSGDAWAIATAFESSTAMTRSEIGTPRSSYSGSRGTAALPDPCIPLAQFAVWWELERRAAALQRFVCGDAYGGGLLQCPGAQGARTTGGLGAGPLAAGEGLHDASLGGLDGSADATHLLLRGAALEERQGSLFRFTVPAGSGAAATSPPRRESSGGEPVAPSRVSVSALFALLERNKAALGIASYSASQSTLEAIFTSVAANNP